jgi:hypothetical protein
VHCSIHTTPFSSSTFCSYLQTSWLSQQVQQIPGPMSDHTHTHSNWPQTTYKCAWQPLGSTRRRSLNRSSTPMLSSLCPQVSASLAVCVTQPAAANMSMLQALRGTLWLVDCALGEKAVTLSKKGHSCCFCSSGSGKTRIAIEIICSKLSALKQAGQVAVFLAPTNPLVDQVRGSEARHTAFGSTSRVSTAALRLYVSASAPTLVAHWVHFLLACRPAGQSAQTSMIT